MFVLAPSMNFTLTFPLVTSKLYCNICPDGGFFQKNSCATSPQNSAFPINTFSVIYNNSRIQMQNFDQPYSTFGFLYRLFVQRKIGIKVWHVCIRKQAIRWIVNILSWFLRPWNDHVGGACNSNSYDLLIQRASLSRWSSLLWPCMCHPPFNPCQSAQCLLHQSQGFLWHSYFLFGWETARLLMPLRREVQHEPTAWPASDCVFAKKNHTAKSLIDTIVFMFRYWRLLYP